MRSEMVQFNLFKKTTSDYVWTVLQNRSSGKSKLSYTCNNNVSAWDVFDRLPIKDTQHTLNRQQSYFHIRKYILQTSLPFRQYSFSLSNLMVNEILLENCILMISTFPRLIQPLFFNFYIFRLSLYFTYMFSVVNYL